MKKSNIRIGLACVLVLGLTAGYASAQGSLTPPGAPAPTMKTLEQVEPRIDLATVAGDATYHHVITETGSYYLSGNLAVTNSSGIHINATGVTLDLNGFGISRAAGVGGSGVRIDGDGSTVRNGNIDGLFHYGVRCVSSEGTLLADLSVSKCELYGLNAEGSTRVVDCRAFDNTGSGIWVTHGSVLTGCTAYDNLGSYGIKVGSGSTLRDCTAYENRSEYGYGIFAGFGSTLHGCSAYDNEGRYGIYVYSGSILHGCTAYRNDGTGEEESCGIYAGNSCSLHGCSVRENVGGSESYGILAASGSALMGCSVTDNEVDIGIKTYAGSSLRGCVARGNEGNGSESYGVYVGNDTAVIECTVCDNGNTSSSSSASLGIGIYAGARSSVENCTVNSNQGDGIRVGNDCSVFGNTCIGNGEVSVGGDGAGIHATSSDNRIEGNHVSDNDRGIDVDVSGNLIVRNSASGIGTHFDIVEGNTTGTIQTSPVGAGAWDNFEF